MRRFAIGALALTGLRVRVVLVQGVAVSVTLLVAGVLAAGCASAGSRSMPVPASLPWAPPPAAQPVPTVNPVFAQQGAPVELTPSVAITGSLPGGTPSNPQDLNQVLQDALLDPTPAAPVRPAQTIVDEPVFDDQLNPNWSTADSIGMRSFFTDTQHAYSGTVGISVTPLQDFGKLFFAVKQNTNETYGLDRVVGVSVWINSGDQPLDPNDLSITVVGSNDNIYWRPDDKSVATDSTHFFSESRLYYLGVKNTVPPYTWVEAVVRLDKLPYEPDYKYVTGVYIKNDEWFRRTFYVDQVHLLVVQ